MADWGTRLLPTIEFTSPGGSKFEAKWNGGGFRSKGMWVQRDRFPLIAGEFGKPLGSGSADYTLVHSFDGINCDLDSERFFSVCDEIGLWEVKHPVHSKKTLLLLGVKETNDPIKSGGIVKIQTRWFEPLDLKTIISPIQIGGLIDTLVLSYAPYMLPIYVATINPYGFGNISAIINAINIAGAIAGQVASGAWSLTTAPESLVSAQTAFNQANQDLVNATAATIEDTANFDMVTMGTPIFEMFNATALGTEDSVGVLALYSTALDNLIAELPSGDYHTRTEDSNKAYAIQMSMEAVIGAATLAQTYTPLSTREQAIAAAKSLAEMFIRTVDALDVVQQQFTSILRPERRYYGQTEGYDKLLNITTQGIKYLLQRTFDLAVEKRFTLQKPKLPIQICFEEFGAKGESRIDDFIEWNQLEGDDIIVLPAGREVVVYLELQ